MSDNEFDLPCIDVREDDLLAISSEVLDTLLKDHTTGHNIFWATHDYESLGSAYDYHSPILPELITGEHGMVILPRVLKSKALQNDRVKDMAEVFTPSWVCNAQNNLVDEAWFGRKDVFNTEDPSNHSWTPNPHIIEFPENKFWKDYVRATRMEITCGEAPYLVSRYDTTTGELIPIGKRIGLLDRKLRVIRSGLRQLIRTHMDLNGRVIISCWHVKPCSGLSSSIIKRNLEKLLSSRASITSLTSFHGISGRWME